MMCLKNFFKRVKLFFKYIYEFRFIMNDKKNNKFISASAVIIVNKDNKILILKRSKDIGAFPNAWNFPAGGEDPGETAVETAIRECLEETSLSVFEESMIYVGSFKIDDSDRVDEIHYFITSNYNGDIELDWENSEYRWVSNKEIASYNFVPIPDLIKYIFENDDVFEGLIS